MVRRLLLGTVRTDPKYVVFVNYHLPLMNFIHEIYPEKSFILVVSNSSNLPQKVSKHVVLGYATRSPKKLISVRSPFVAHTTESLGYVPHASRMLGRVPTKSYKKPPNVLEKLLKTPEASTLYPVIYR